MNTAQTSAQEKKTLYEQYKKEKKVSVNVPPLYRPYFGNVMPVNINGIMICVPVDGTTVKIPQTFATEVQARMQNINALIDKGNRMAQFSSNLEYSPGELEF